MFSLEVRALTVPSSQKYLWFLVDFPACTTRQVSAFVSLSGDKSMTTITQFPILAANHPPGSWTLSANLPEKWSYKLDVAVWVNYIQGQDFIYIPSSTTLFTLELNTCKTKDFDPTVMLNIYLIKSSLECSVLWMVRNFPLSLLLNQFLIVMPK